ncbi:MAG: serine hydrolase, partial [Gemmatimonadales bacterium]
QGTDRPARGAYAPGAHWFYNNWDFNVAGVIYQQRTGEKLYESFRRRIAKPIGMQDFEVSDGFEVLEPSRSVYPAHTFRMSTRDLARFGQLYLQNGKWNGRQIVPSSWVKESTSSTIEIAPKQRYGYMWWIYDADSASTRYPRASQHRLYQARGTGGQVMFVIPDEEMVIVLRGDTDNNRNVGGGASWTIVERILSAKESAPAASPRVVALAPIPFQSQAPAPPLQKFMTLSRAALEKFVGNYTMGPNEIARVFMYEGRLFMFFPGQGEAELFALAPNEFTVRVLAGVNIKFDLDTQGTATAVSAKLGPDTMRGTRSQ